MARAMRTHRQSSGGEAHAQLARAGASKGTVPKFSIGKLPFKRLVREVANDIKVGLRFEDEAMLELQMAAEEYLEDIFKDSNLCATQASRVTVTVEDIQSARRTRGERVYSRNV